MKSDFLADLLENNARAKLMRAMIFNENDIFTATNALKRTGVTKKTAQKEFKAMEKLGLVKQSRSVTVQTAGGKKSTERKLTEKAWSLNTDFTHMRALASFVREVSPFRFEQVLESIKKTGKISAVILSGSFMGDPTRPTDILLAADYVNERRLESAIKTLEPMFGRELRYASFTTPEFRYRLTVQDRLLRDTLDFPHMVLLDKSRLL